jgi:phage shock protein E
MLVVFAIISVSASAKEIILDVRTPEEVAAGSIKNSINIDFRKENFKSEILKLAKNATYKLYCRSGNRSGQALQLMKELGFKNLQNLGSLEDARKALGQFTELDKNTIYSK